MSRRNCSSEFKLDKTAVRSVASTNLSALPFKSHTRDAKQSLSIGERLRNLRPANIPRDGEVQRIVLVH